MTNFTSESNIERVQAKVDALRERISTLFSTADEIPMTQVSKDLSDAQTLILMACRRLETAFPSMGGGVKGYEWNLAVRSRLLAAADEINLVLDTMERP